MNWVDSAQDRDYWRALVNAALKLRVQYAMELVNMSEIIWRYKSIKLQSYSMYWIDVNYDHLQEHAKLFQIID